MPAAFGGGLQVLAVEGLCHKPALRCFGSLSPILMTLQMIKN